MNLAQQHERIGSTGSVDSTLTSSTDSTPFQTPIQGFDDDDDDDKKFRKQDEQEDGVDVDVDVLSHDDDLPGTPLSSMDTMTSRAVDIARSKPPHEATVGDVPSLSDITTVGRCSLRTGMVERHRATTSRGQRQTPGFTPGLCQAKQFRCKAAGILIRKKAVLGGDVDV